MIYLDTHVVAWLYAGDVAKLSSTAQHLINTHDLKICPIVQLELAYLHEIGRLTETARNIVSDLYGRIGLELCPHPFDQVIQAAIAMTWTPDPFDRIIVGQASVNNDVLVTKDTTIRQHYPNAHW